jgi:hypothetical protein
MEAHPGYAGSAASNCLVWAVPSESDARVRIFTHLILFALTHHSAALAIHEKYQISANIVSEALLDIRTTTMLNLQSTFLTKYRGTSSLKND